MAVELLSVKEFVDVSGDDGFDAVAESGVVTLEESLHGVGLGGVDDS